MPVFQNIALEKRLEQEGEDARPYREALAKLRDEANDLYSRTTWSGWVDHGSSHINCVVRLLDRMIPPVVQSKLTPEEIFVLLAGAMLHDVGMAEQGNVSLKDIRREHGERGVRIIKKRWRHVFPDGRSLRRTCEVVRNHHGKFSPRADSTELAILVRLADGLDFGPDRAPQWVLEIIDPPAEQLKYWEEHLRLDSPEIDSELLRVEVSGSVPDDRFIATLRENFETPHHAKFQDAFFQQRGISTTAVASYVIIDKTTKAVPPGEDYLKALIRPTSFSRESYLVAARYLYNVGYYTAARTCFEDSVSKSYENKWTKDPCDRYLYHYLQTFNKLGLYEEALAKTKTFEWADFDVENRAAIQIVQGIAHLKLGRTEHAHASFDGARDYYEQLPRDDETRTVNLADSRAWRGITCLERLRSEMDAGIDVRGDAERLDGELEEVRKLYADYQEKHQSGETHYYGRYYGLKAFCHLLNLDIARKRYGEDSKLDPDQWEPALDDAAKSYGGPGGDNRVPFGMMSGRYCEAAVLWHKHKHCSDQEERSQALLQSAKSLTYVLKGYSAIYQNREIAWMWDKISSLCHNVVVALEGAKEAKVRDAAKEIEKLQGSLPRIESKDAQIFTPLN